MGTLFFGAFACAAVLWGAAASGEPVSDEAAVRATLTELDKLVPSDADMVKGPVAEARRALERARSARQSGDAHHAEQLEGLAREWTETARDVLRAASTEKDAGATQSAVATATTQAERNRALIEETIARKMRAAAEVATLEAQGRTPQSSSAGDAGAAKTKGKAVVPPAAKRPLTTAPSKAPAPADERE